MPVRLVSQEELPGPLKGYRLLERLGRGGFGEVWKVEAPGGFQKAMKFVFGDLDAAEGDDSRPAEQERKALERVKLIRHPYILTLEQVQIIDGQLIIVMELADRNLWDRFRECRSQGLSGIPRDELLRYLEETAEALDLMNNHYRIQHLDVKPQNLFLVFNHIKVADFGLAKMFEGGRGTITGGVTPVYAAPETFEGYASRFTDQYSLGIVFQELLTGTRPFNGTTTRQLLMQHINGTPDMSPLTADDRAVISRALSKKPDDRWPTCTDLVRALRQVGGGGTGAGGSEPGAPADSSMVTRPQSGSGEVKTQTPRPGTPVGLGGLTNRPPSNPGTIVNSTPLPALVTVGPSGAFIPKLVTPSAAAANNPAVTLQRPAIVQTGRMASLGIAPPEKTGDGSLFPAIIVAVGGTGRAVVERVKQIVRDRYGDPDFVPNVRFLYVDTDPTVEEEGPGLSPRDVVPARLQRPAHYLQRDSLPALDSWLPAGMLYKLARSPGSSGGVRAFGRLALLDNYRAVAQRVRQEVEAFLTDAPLTEADRMTGLGLRTNRPRAYVITGLGGGTGSGMFIDLAYLIRHELRGVGYSRPEVVGVLFAPPADKRSPRNAALGNAYAALTELHHFQSKKDCYEVAFDKREGSVLDTDAPFARVAVLPLPRTPDPKKQAAVTGLAARALFQEILTPAGRVSDEVRDVFRKAYSTDRPTCQTFGLYRLSLPRPEMLTAATRRFAQRLLQRWTAKEAVHLREPISAWLTRQWAERGLGFEAVVDGFYAAVRSALREEPDRVFDAVVDPVRTRTPSGSRMDANAACVVLDQLIKLVGKPDGDDDQRGSLFPPLSAKYDEAAKDAEGSVAFMAVSFLEQPQYRLAGAEEAVRQIGDRLKQQIDALEAVRSDLHKEVRTAFARLFQLIGGLGSGSSLAVWKGGTAEVLDLLRAYPRSRLRLHVLDLALAIYRKLHGNVPEYLREINYCRTTLADFHATVGKASGSNIEPIGPGQLILPDGCPDLDSAADRFLASLNPEDILAFDQDLQKDTTRKFKGLAAVCLKPQQKGPVFRELLLVKSRTFLDARLDHADPAAMFFRDRPETSAQSALWDAYTKASPEMSNQLGPNPGEMVILAVPGGPSGEKLRVEAALAVHGVDLTPAPLPDDIAFYREYPQVDLTGLPQLGDLAREAYQNMDTEQPPHSRCDIPWQSPTAQPAAPPAEPPRSALK
jgi:serine/threonine protein kinase